MNVSAIDKFQINKMCQLIQLMFLIILVSITSAGFQSLRVYGKLTCKGQPYGGAKIKLYDHDTFTLDDKLAEGSSDSDGTFDLEGMGNERTRLNAKLNIYHRCDKTIPLCYYKYSSPIPYTYISAGPRALNPYNVQTLELSMLEKERDCFNKK